MSKLLFERSVSGRRGIRLDPIDVPEVKLDEQFVRQSKPRLPEIGEVDLVRPAVTEIDLAFDHVGPDRR